MKQYLPAILTFVIVSAVTVIGFTLTQSNFKRVVQIEFEQAAQDRATAVQLSIINKLLILESMQSLYTVFKDEPGPEFRAFVEPFESEHEGIQGLEWVVRVKDAERENFEESMREKGIAEFQISERTAQGVMIRAARRDEYYTTLAIEPINENEPALGFDIGSNPMRRQALERAMDNRSNHYIGSYQTG